MGRRGGNEVTEVTPKHTKNQWDADTDSNTYFKIELSLNIVESYCGGNTKTSIACQEKDVIFLKS